MTLAQWDRRIRRATELTSTYPFGAEGLRFYARVATFQKSLYAEIQKALKDSPKISADRPLRDELDLFLLLPHFSAFLSLIQQIAPAPLGQAAAGLAQKGPAAWQHAIEDFWHGDPELAAAADGARRTAGRRFARCNFFRSIAGVDFSSAVRRVSCRSPRNQRSWMELPRLARFAAASPSSAY